MKTTVLMAAAFALALVGCAALKEYLASPEVADTVSAAAGQAASGNLAGAVATVVGGLATAGVVVYLRRRKASRG